MNKILVVYIFIEWLDLIERDTDGTQTDEPVLQKQRYSYLFETGRPLNPTAD